MMKAIISQMHMWLSESSGLAVGQMAPRGRNLLSPDWITLSSIGAMFTTLLTIR